MSTLFFGGVILGGLALLARKGRGSHRPLSGDRSDYEIRKEVEQDLQKWRDKAFSYWL